MNGICISYFFGDFSKPLGDFSLKHPVTLLAHAVNKTKIQKGGFFHRIFCVSLNISLNIIVQKLQMLKSKRSKSSSSDEEEDSSR
jgi:hypothetical protein